MPGTTALLSYVIATILIVIVPGPTVTVIIANSLKHGSRAGLLNVAGTQIGLASMIAVLAGGYAAVVAVMGNAFEVLRILGAAYLIWLGIRLWRSDGRIADGAPGQRPFGSFIIQGFVVIWSNPKALLFFGAFIPQFIVADGDAGLQILLLGLIFMAVATICDGLYAFAAGGAGAWLSRGRVKLVERIAGTFLIGGGAWLLAARR